MRTACSRGSRLPVRGGPSSAGRDTMPASFAVVRQLVRSSVLLLTMMPFNMVGAGPNDSGSSEADPPVDFNRDPCNVLFKFSHLPQCDARLSARERAAALAAAMTVGQKVGFVGGGYQSGMRDLGIPLVTWSDGIFMSTSNNWLGRSPAGKNLSNWKPFPTVLPGPMTMAASFDLDLVARAATMVSDEARSLVNDVSAEYGLVGTIVMNTCRDPRWGRCQVTRASPSMP
eukprot:SAG22_NODE_1498_length_4288_cov_3.110289_1_plen_229_part_10